MSQLTRKLACALSIAALISTSVTALADAPESPDKTTETQKTNTQFVRIHKEKDKGAEAFQTAVVRYVPKDSDGESSDGELVVDLIGVVHVGEKKYYESLNDKFKGYDAMLYELVSPKGMVPRKDRPRKQNGISLLHSIPQSMLGLESQMDHIDYTPDNFVHADLSPKEISEVLRKRGENEVTLILGVLTDIMKQQQVVSSNANGKATQNGIPTVDPVELMEALGDQEKMKRLFAKQLVATGSTPEVLGDTLTELLIRDRNKAAVAVLKAQISKGKKRLAIFYGAAHLPDLEKRLVSELNMKPVDQQWRTAWTLEPKEPPQQNLAGALLRLLQQLE